jgi:hypothetical protein
METSMIRRLSIHSGGRAALFGAVILVSGACSTSAAGRAGALQSTLPLAGMNQPRSPVLTLNVTNRGWSNVVVYLADGSTPRRLGSVPPLKDTQIVIYRGSGPLRILLRPTGSNESFAPEPVWVEAGQLVELTVHPMLQTSEMIVR